MSIVALSVLSTVNAPYGTALSAGELARKLSDHGSVACFDASVFSFLSEVDEGLQKAFVNEMHLDPAVVVDQARKFSALAGYTLPLARAA